MEGDLLNIIKKTPSQGGEVVLYLKVHHQFHTMFNKHIKTVIFQKNL